MCFDDEERIIPVCPDCEQEMTKATIEIEPDEWIIVWLCDCEPDWEYIAYMEEHPEEVYGI